MSRRVKNLSKPRGQRSSVARQVRSLVTSLAVPALLAACAPVPHVHSGAGTRTVLYVGPREKPVDDVAEAPKDAPAAKDSPAGRYIPLSPDLPFYEKLHFKRRNAQEAQAKQAKARKEMILREQEAEADGEFVGPRRPARTAASVMAPPSVKAMKDGIWDRVRRRLMLTGVEQERVAAEVEKLRQSPGKVSFLSKRAEPYLFYIVDEIERRGLPMDLVMVPMVESAFDPGAVSPKQAAGIWQFIPTTAANYGLKLEEGYDGRYDVYASTKAALKYFSRLHAMFGGDWLLALAAYNVGEGAVQRAVAANQKAGLGTTFWDLELPAETKAYVPKILALSKVIADPGGHGMSLRKISPLPYLARVEVSGEAPPLAEAVAATGMSWEEFRGLNPAFKPDVPPAAPFNVLLPLDKAEALAANLQGAKLVAARKYVVKKGETLVVIARHQGVPALKLAEWNGLKADSRVKPGQELIIYPV